MGQVIRGGRQLGAMLRNERLRRKLTQTALTDLSGVEQKTISAVENGSEGTKLVTIFRLIGTLGLDLQIVPRQQGPSIADVF